MILIINNYVIRKINYFILNRNLSFFMTSMLYIYILFQTNSKFAFLRKKSNFCEQLFVVYAGLINILFIVNSLVCLIIF
jgi:hypothetical protein